MERRPGVVSTGANWWLIRMQDRPDPRTRRLEALGSQNSSFCSFSELFTVSEAGEQLTQTPPISNKRTFGCFGGDMIASTVSRANVTR